MRFPVAGFLAGTLALIVVYVIVQPGTASKATQGGNLVVAGMQALLSPGRAGIADHTRAGVTDTLTPPAAPPSGGSGTPKFT